MKIDRMTKNQLEAVAQLEQRCFSHPWSFNSLEEELNNETSLFLPQRKITPLSDI